MFCRIEDCILEFGAGSLVVSDRQGWVIYSNKFKVGLAASLQQPCFVGYEAPTMKPNLHGTFDIRALLWGLIGKSTIADTWFATAVSG